MADLLQAYYTKHLKAQIKIGTAVTVNNHPYHDLAAGAKQFLQYTLNLFSNNTPRHKYNL